MQEQVRAQVKLSKSFLYNFYVAFMLRFEEKKTNQQQEQGGSVVLQLYMDNVETRTAKSESEINGHDLQ